MKAKVTAQRVRAEGRSVKEQAPVPVGTLAAPAPSEPLLSFTCLGDPMGKPRMTQRDRWQQRECVVRYRLWCDRLREAAGLQRKLTLVKGRRLTVRAYFALPKSWSTRLKNEAIGSIHLHKPDFDNVAKGCADALFENDHLIYFGTCEKRWDDGRGARTEVELI